MRVIAGFAVMSISASLVFASCNQSSSTPAGANPPSESGELAFAGVSGNTYTSPAYGYAVTWDAWTWEVNPDWTTSRDGFDSLRLDRITEPDTDPTGELTIHGSPASTTDARECAKSGRWEPFSSNVGDALPRVRYDDISEVEGDASRAYRIYEYSVTRRGIGGDRNFDVVERPPPTYTTRHTAFVECRVLIPRQAMLTLVLEAPRDDYDDAFTLASQVVERLVFRPGP